MDRRIAQHFPIPWYRSARLVAAAACVVVATTGCQHDEGTAPPPVATTQPVLTVPSAVNDFIDAQVANGAAGDATLYRGHFDGDQLNSLGREKLALLAQRHEAGQHVTVYVDTSDGSEELSTARRDAVSNYLAHAGVAKEALEIRPGPNPDGYYAHSAAEAIRGLQKTDSDYQSQQTDQPMSGSHGGGGGGGYGGAEGSSPGR